MMPVIRLTDATFSELKTIATWLSANTPSEAINRLVREKFEQLGLEHDGVDEPHIGSDHELMKLSETPGLSFTRVIKADVDGQTLKKSNWANLLVETMAALKTKGLSGQKLVDEIQVPAKLGNYTKEGYSYNPALGISVQGQSAQEAWKEVERIARRWGIPVCVEFQWRQHKNAQHPGKSAVLKAGK